MTVDEELKKLYDLSDLINLRINFLTKNDIEFLNKNRSYFNKHIAEFIIDFISDAENINKKLLIIQLRQCIGFKYSKNYIDKEEQNNFRIFERLYQKMD